MIKQHFQNELVKCGYPDDLTIEYSLGYCQGWRSLLRGFER